MTHPWTEPQALDLVRGFVSRELPPGTQTPGDEEDLVKAGLIDSMGWVAILSAIEEAAGIRDFGSVWPEGRPQSIHALVEACREGVTGSIEATLELEESHGSRSGGATTSLLGWGFALGSLRVATEEVERQCGVAPGTLRDGAGIESVCRADNTENELALGGKAAEAAFNVANVAPEAVDFVVATSATFLAFPSLSASLHSLLLLRESCGAIDVGGACVGLIQALATAKALLANSRSGVALVVASEVHSRRISCPKVPGEFGGLFGDGACAFVVGCPGSRNNGGVATVGEFVWGCSGTLASALRLSLADAGEIEVRFKGEQLASAAVSTLERTLNQLERLSGRSRSEVSYFAVHEPNPRVIQILAQRARIPLEKIPLVSSTQGNLGSVTCGVSLCTALKMAHANEVASARPLIFLAAVGPGLLWGGTYFR
jgi:3-oxoacyl-[acyl-carrier-protein] synthase III